MPDSLYIHIPFCIKKCMYCDFLSVPYDKAFAGRYIDALCGELRLKKESAGRLKTIYIGGGTPSILSEESFELLFRCLRDIFNFSDSVEITVEVNPGTINGSKIKRFLSLGINRLSIGIQSFNDKELKILGRIHTSDDASRSIELIQEAGLNNLSLDLIYGIPQQTIETWQESISKAVGLLPSHISAYELTPEEKTPLYGLIKSNKIKMSDEEIILEMYNYAIDYLAVCGYKHYEITNFALPGFRSIHNLNYWDRGEYIGAGAGAHSFISGVRSKNTEDINRYIEDLNNRIIPEIESTQLTSADIRKEFIFLGLRKTEGISIIESEKLGLNITEACGELINEECLEIDGNYLRLTRKGLTVSNTIIVRLFERLRLD